jgi:signal transduction histidine kinase
VAMDLAVEVQQLCGLEPMTAETENKVELGLHLVEDQDLEVALASTLQPWQAKMLESVAGKTRDIAHQLNNVLSIIYGHADLIEDSIGPQDALSTNVASIRAAGFRAAHLVRQLNLVREMITDRVANSHPETLPFDPRSNVGLPILQPWKFENWGFPETAVAAF